MRRLCFILIVLSGTAHGQIHYKMFEKNPCDNSVTQRFLFQAYKDTSHVLTADILSSEIIFADTGKYRIGVINEINGIKNLEDFHLVIIDGKTNEVSDTIKNGLIDKRTYMFDPPFTEYYCCDKKCDGKFTSNYNGGQVRMKGEFKNGQPIRTLTEYYLNGNTKSIRTIKGKRTFNQHFLSNGTIYEAYTTKRIKGWDIYIESKSYSQGNKLRTHEKNNKRGLKKRWTYDSHGLLTEYREFNLLKQFDENGNLKLKAKRKRPFEFDNLCADYFKFWKKNKDCRTMWEFYDFKFKVITWDNGVKRKRVVEYFAVEDQFFFPDNFDNPDYEKSRDKKNLHTTKCICQLGAICSL